MENEEKTTENEINNKEKDDYGGKFHERDSHNINDIVKEKTSKNKINDKSSEDFSNKNNQIDNKFENIIETRKNNQNSNNFIDMKLSLIIVGAIFKASKKLAIPVNNNVILNTSLSFLNKGDKNINIINTIAKG